MPADVEAKQRIARAFVASVDLSDLAQHGTRFFDAPPASFTPDAGKDQAAIVGSGILCYARGVSAERRSAVNDSALLAQLIANKTVPDASDIPAWYDAYFGVLTSVGWVFRERGFSRYDASSDNADVHDAILSIAAGLLGGAAASAYQVIRVTLDTLKSLSDSSPWLTLFARESQYAHAARFQVSVVAQDDGEFVASLMAFELDASVELSQVLFFKFKSERTTLQQYSGTVAIDDAVLASVSADIAAKIAAFTTGYVKGLPDLGTPAS